MEATRLIQRLLLPLSPPAGSKPNDPKTAILASNPFAFGSGGGRLSEQATALLAPILRFDYMGDALYEYGAVPKALQRMVEYAQQDELGRSLLVFRPDAIKVEYVFREDTPRPDAPCYIWILGRRDDIEAIEGRVDHLIRNEALCLEGRADTNIQLHDALGLGHFLKYQPRTLRHQVVAGLELDNGFLISADHVLADKLFHLLTGKESP